MLKTLRLTLIVFTVSTSSAGVIRWIAARQPVPIMALFTNPDGALCERLCLFGVQPGVTSIECAREFLYAHPFTRDFKPNLEGDIFKQGTAGVIMTSGLGDDRVSSIELVVTNNPDWGSLGEVIAVLGNPEYVLVDKSYIRSYWYGGEIEFTHTHRQPDRLDPDDELIGLTIRVKPNHSPSEAVPWRGFATVTRYVAVKP